MRFSVEGGDKPSVFTIVLQGGGPGRGVVKFYEVEGEGKFIGY